MSRRDRFRTIQRARFNVETLESRQLLAFGVTQFPVSQSNSEPQGIATGSDGNLWFTETFASKIGTFDPLTHTETDIPLPSDQVAPGPIIAGPDGNLWFTADSTTAVGFTITSINPTTHAFTEYPVVIGSQIDGLAFDGNGSLWLTFLDGNKVSKFDPTTNAFTSYTTPSGIFQSMSITQGPGGSIWFTETGIDKVATINTTTNQITEYPIVGEYPGSITLGPDGNLWYTLGSFEAGSFLPSAEAIGTINPSTLATAAFSAPTPPVSIAKGPGDFLTFTSGTTGQIGLINATTKAFSTVQFTDPRFSGDNVTGVTTGPADDTWFLGLAPSNVGGNIGQVKTVADSTTSLTAAPNPSMLGTPITFTAQVAPAVGSVVATGSVNFLDGTTVIGTKPLNPSGVATFTDSGLAIATHSITALYLGNPTLGQSLSNLVNQVVQPIATTLTVVTSANPTTVAQQVQFTTTVHDATGALATAGNVSYFQGDSVNDHYLGYAPVVNGTSTFLLPILTAGSYPIFAYYSGSDTLAKSQATTNLVVNPTPTVITLASADNPQTTGRPITLDVSITPYVYSLQPTGIVTFYDGSTVLGAAYAENGASLTLPELPAGNHVITAVYSGDPNFLGGTSNPVIQQVFQVYSTTTTVYATPNPIPFQSVFSLTIGVASNPLPGVPANAGPLPTPTGTVTVTEFTNLFTLYLGQFPINASGQVVLSYLATDQLSLNVAKITVSYSGDANHAPSDATPIYLTYAAPDGPQVRLITTAGARASTKTLVVYFDEPLYPSTSQNVKNYKIVGSNGRSRVVVNRAVFNPLNNSVKLTLRAAVPINGNYQLTIVGTGLNGTTDTGGRLLDGGFTGIPGSNFSTPLTFKNVFVARSLPVAPKVSHKR